MSAHPRQHKRLRRLRNLAFGVGLVSALTVTGISFAAESNAPSNPETLAAATDASDALLARRDAVKDAIAAAKLASLNSYAVGVDPGTGRVGATLFFSGDASVQGTDGLDLGADVDVTKINGSAAPNLDVRAGNNLEPGCTAAFSVEFSNGGQGLMTAAHCFDQNTAANTQNFQIASSANGVYSTIGAIGERYTNNATAHRDWGIVTINTVAGLNEALPEVVNPNGTAYTVKNIVNGLTAISTAICKYGRTTQETCGKTTLNYVTVTYAEVRDANGNIIKPAVQVDNLTQTDYCSEPGDSGGPVFAKTSGNDVTAVGVHSGGATTANGQCLSKSGGHDIAFFTPMAYTDVTTTSNTSPVWLRTR